MIKISGSTHRKFDFPADPMTAFDFYSNLDRTLSYLPHISVLERFTETEFRMIYHTSELGIYRVRVFCDMRAEFNRQDRILAICPLEGISPISSKAGMYSLTGQGFYHSESIFHEQGDFTKIEYRLNIHATLPTPLGLRFMPTKLIDGIAKGITQWRIEEIADGFIERSLQAFKTQ